MWSCCGSRDPKDNKFLVWDQEWKSDVKAVAAPKEDEVEVEVEYVALNSYDKASIVGAKAIGHSFAGKIKLVGAKVAPEKFKAGDLVYGSALVSETGVISEFIIVPAISVAKIPSGVKTNVAAALPHIVHVANQFEPFLAKDKKVIYAGAKGGYYESVFNAVAAKNGAVIVPSIEAEGSFVDFLFHTEGGIEIAGLKPEKYSRAWSLVPKLHGGFVGDKKVAELLYALEKFADVDVYTQKKENVEKVLAKVKFSGNEVISSKDKLKETLAKLSVDGTGPIIIDIGVLGKLPKKEKPATPSNPTTSGTPTN
jgi:hypothetical protein